MKAVPNHSLPETAVLLDILETELLSIYFYRNFVIVEADEGVTLSYKQGFPILVKGLKHIGSKDFGYISNRVNSYSVNPNDYKYLNKIPNLKGIAIVASQEPARRSAALEANFCKKPFAVFQNLSEAYEWTQELLENN